MTCFNSSDPAAENATVLFDLYDDDNNLWTRRSHEGPLPLCSSPVRPPDYRCWVCRDRIVFAFCRNLTDGVKVMMEAGSASVDLSKSDCPKPPAVDDAPTSQPLGMILGIVFAILFLLLIGVLVYIYRKHCKNLFEPKRQETKEDEEECKEELRANGTP